VTKLFHFNKNWDWIEQK